MVGFLIFIGIVVTAATGGTQWMTGRLDEDFWARTISTCLTLALIALGIAAVVVRN